MITTIATAIILLWISVLAGLAISLLRYDRRKARLERAIEEIYLFAAECWDANEEGSHVDE